ncbi:MAG: DUF58 domain-containing protein [Pirellulales bacterium]|nr:DUF58 domain-containing protein [Pirellulales bacterium]
MLSRLEGLELRARSVVEGYVAGLHRSPLHGFSIEFAQHREYAPGDDLRHVDWKVFGRTDKFYLKQYEEETNLIAYVLVDTSESMRYKGTNSALSKLEYAQTAAASLAYLILRQRDSVGLVTFDKEIRSTIRPSGQASHLKHLLHVLEETVPERKTSTGPIFHELAERFSRRGIVIIFSDLFDDVSSMLAGLKHFRHKRHDVIVFHTLDADELDFPFKQPTRFRGMEEAPTVMTNPRSLKKAYLRELQRFRIAVKAGCHTHRIEYVDMRTDRPLDQALTSYLAHRMDRSRF